MCWHRAPYELSYDKNSSSVQHLYSTKLHRVLVRLGDFKMNWRGFSESNESIEESNVHSNKICIYKIIRYILLQINHKIEREGETRETRETREREIDQYNNHYHAT
jgi:hypothetical protein